MWSKGCVEVSDVVLDVLGPKGVGIACYEIASATDRRTHRPVTKPFVWIAGSALLVVAVQCGGVSRHRDGPAMNEPADTVPEPVPVEELSAGLADAFCRYYAACQSGAAARSWPGGCTAALEARLTNSLAARLERGVRAGTIRYDPAVVGECLASLAALDCAASVSSAPDGYECPEGFDGTVGPGGACIDDLECAGDARCSPDFGTGACGGRCVRRGQAGEACQFGADCTFETTCACDDLGCACRALGSAGQSCAYGCQGSLVCVNDSGAPTCERPVSGKVGQRCDDALVVCPRGTACVHDGAGENSNEAHCVALAASGARCGAAQPSSCADDEWCRLTAPNYDVGSCSPVPVDGDPCESPYDCDSRLGRCVDGACTVKRDNGKPCSIGDDCWSDVCFDGLCSLSPCAR
jgi:hypothetical protein